jgi:hypothetical protein
MTGSLDPRNARAYRRRARLSRSLGLAAIPVALVALLQRDLVGASSAAIALAGPLDTLWLLGYLLGGILLLAGVQWRPYPRPELEGLGVWLMIGAMLINGLAIVAVRGPIGGGLTSLGLFAVADVLYARARDLDEARRRDRRWRHKRPIDVPDRREQQP